MITASRVAEHRRSVQALAELAISDLAALLRSLPLDNAVATREALRAVLPDLVAAYGEPAATLAADWFEEIREDAAVRGRFSTVLPDLPTTSRTDALARWGVSPLFADAPDVAKALSLLSGGVQRLVAGMDRQTIEANIARDPAGPRYARHASANACAFCRMLATRGAVFVSEQSAGRVTGESLGGTDYRKMRREGTSRESILAGSRRGTVAQGGRKGRATRQSLGDKYHDHCHCTAVAVWPGQELEVPSYVKQWERDYAAATAEVGARDASAVLAHLREHTGAR